MNRLSALINRELVVVHCLYAATAALRLGLHARERATGGLAGPPAVWYDRAERSLLFALAELAYLTGPAPARTLDAVPPRLRPRVELFALSKRGRA